MAICVELGCKRPAEIVKLKKHVSNSSKPHCTLHHQMISSRRLIALYDSVDVNGANCKNDTSFADIYHTPSEARKKCFGCASFQACKAYADFEPQTTGIWAGEQKGEPEMTQVGFLVNGELHESRELPTVLVTLVDAVGLDLLDWDKFYADEMEEQAIRALRNLEGSPDYYASWVSGLGYGAREGYGLVLDFLRDVVELCSNIPSAVLEITDEEKGKSA